MREALLLAAAQQGLSAINVRLGVHVGPIVGGVIGVALPRWGFL